MSYIGRMTTSQDAVAGYSFHEGDRIRKAREVLGLSQAELALKSQVSRGTVQNYEAGSRVKPIARTTLAVALDVSEEWLRTGVLDNPNGGGANADNSRTTGRYSRSTSCTAEMQGRARLHRKSTVTGLPVAA